MFQTRRFPPLRTVEQIRGYEVLLSERPVFRLRLTVKKNPALEAPGLRVQG
jgi:hypothetical protein